jgi:hypothetical protein
MKNLFWLIMAAALIAGSTQLAQSENAAGTPESTRVLQELARQPGAGKVAETAQALLRTAPAR